ncbi:hypothetical protein PP505_gp72 [Gordonia phage Dorito]|uniref:Uncharacterized protein n=1 Tax=Gordonia phage Dorito TaxID=2499023 RepID=A0A3S9UAM7_9CAUD|nr:hypothetical protein PP505_gp72 [Gordonia phage Dorito]AZS07342.1 hypothetical protein PBI_DORITO_72 [Gordonia phage Dorito]
MAEQLTHEHAVAQIVNADGSINTITEPCTAQCRHEHTESSDAPA